MPVQVWHDPVEVPDAPAPDLQASTHRSRVALERVLAEPGDDEAWDFLALTYDEMAPEWTEWVETQPWHAASVAAGLQHARPVDWIVEIGCGTGQATELLSQVGPPVAATDINLSMLRGAPELPHVCYLAADVRHLPFGDASVPMLVSLNGVPDFREFSRVLGVGGQLLWCTSFGPGTPLYLPPDRVADMLGPDWTSEAGHAGHGDWLLAVRIH